MFLCGGGVCVEGLCLKDFITDFKHQPDKLHVMFLDLADVVGRMDHKIVVDALKTYGCPKSLPI